jgi:hypothetical protein
MWAWMAILLVAVIAYKIFTAKKAPAASTQSPTDTTNSSLIPQFVNQVYTNGTPPAGHNPRGGTTTTAPPTEAGGTVTMSLPNAGGTSWEQVVFPNQAAVDAWNAWNQQFVNDNGAQAYRSQWNQELTSLGVTGVNGAPLTPPNPNSPNPYDRI